MLYGNRAPDGINSAGKLREQTIAGSFEYAAVVLSQQWFETAPTMSSELVNGAYFINADQAEPVTITGVQKPASIVQLRTGADVAFTCEGDTLTFDLPTEARSDSADAVKITWS